MTNAEPRVITDNMVVSVHTGARGIQLFQFAPDDYAQLTWGRRMSDASACDITCPAADLSRLDRVEPWRDWASVYDDDNGQMLWTGPITAARENRTGIAISAKDHMTYLSRSRVPITKRWDARDPSIVAGELWRAMADQHGVGRATAVVRPDPEGQRYDYDVTKDGQTLDQVFNDLAGMGMRYSVVAGTPIFGPLGRQPVATLSEDDFEGDGITFVKDGTAVVNDVLVRGNGLNARARTDLYGLNLQALINRDSLEGISNIQSAANAYVKETGRVTTRLELAPNTTLKPTAPVTLDDLMPTNRFVIEARGIRQLFELTAAEFDRQAAGTAIRVTMNSVNVKLELDESNGGGGQVRGGAANR